MVSLDAQLRMCAVLKASLYRMLDTAQLLVMINSIFFRGVVREAESPDLFHMTRCA